MSESRKTAFETDAPTRLASGGFARGEDSLERPDRESLLLPDADVTSYRELVPEHEADHLLVELLGSIAWTQEKIKLYSREIDVPRLTAWYGDPGRTYTYSGISMSPAPWTSALVTIKERVEAVSRTEFNSVLLNLYRDGNDGVSWHSDDEPELGANPVIASVSLGDTRSFQLKHRFRKDLARVDVDLTHGSLLLMGGTTQHFWRHRVPKTSRPVKPRVNLTFRAVR